MPGTEGAMLVFDDFIEGVDKFAERIQPLMQSRRTLLEIQEIA